MADRFLVVTTNQRPCRYGVVDLSPPQNPFDPGGTATVKVWSDDRVWAEKFAEWANVTFPSLGDEHVGVPL